MKFCILISINMFISEREKQILRLNFDYFEFPCGLLLYLPPGRTMRDIGYCHVELCIITMLYHVFVLHCYEGLALFCARSGTSMFV